MMQVTPKVLRHNGSPNQSSDEMSFVEWTTDNAPGMTGRPGGAVKLLDGGRLGLAATTEEAEQEFQHGRKINSFE
jgi:hypothetical protein